MKGPLVGLVAKSSPPTHHGAKLKGKEPAHPTPEPSPRSAARQGFDRQSFERHADDAASTSSSSSGSGSSSRSSSQRSSFTGSLPDDGRTGQAAAPPPLYLRAAAARIDEPLLPPRPPFRSATGRIVTPDSAYGSMDDVNSLPCPTSTSSSPPSSRCSSASFSSPPSDSGFGSSNAPSPVPSALDVRLLRPSNSARASSRSSTRTGIILHRQTRSKSVGATAAHRRFILTDEKEAGEGQKESRRPVLTIDLSEPIPAAEGWEEDTDHHLRIQPGHWRLKRRHTTPALSRRPAVAATADSTARSLVPWRSSPPSGLPQATRSFVTASLALTALAFASPSLPISPTSWLRHVPWPPTPTAPVYLLEPRHAAWSSEWLNALLNAPLLALDPAAVQTRQAGETFAVGALVALARFGLLALAEQGLAPRRRREGPGAFVGLMAALWLATVMVRVGVGYGLGRLTGWQWPGLFFGGAIHEWSLGIGPLLWALLPFQAIAASRPSPAPAPSSPSMRRHRRKISWSTPAAPRRHHRAPLTAIVASRRRLDLSSVARKGGVVAPAIANLLLTFLSPHAELWWCLSGLVAGSVLALVALSRPRPALSLSKGRIVVVRMALAAVALAVVSALRDARVGSGPSAVDPGTSSDGAMYALHPTQSKVLTVLLMTAPRPGHPDFLIRTLSTYLSSFPDPSANPLAGSRLSLVVYTHFADHPVFEHARDVVFARDPKARHYVSWVQQRPRDGDRLDQRLHLARALGLVSRGERPEDVPAYVLLAEDDFPLCPDEALSPSSYAGSPLALLKAGDGDEVEKPTYAASWSTLSRLMLAANAKMPDLATDPRAESGHCGVWVGTGGSGLIMRGWLADRLPGLLLGDDDVDGQRREGQGLTPEQVASEAPPTDVLIQDCLLGKLPGCEACAAPDLSSSSSTAKAAGLVVVDSEPFRRSPALAALRRAYLALSAGDRPREPTVSARRPGVAPGDRWGKSGLVTSERLLMRHLGYNASTIPGRSYKREEWDCGWRHPFNGDPFVLTL